MSRQDFLTRLKEAAPGFPALSARIVPASFELSDPDLCGYPLSADWSWPSCADTLRSWSAHGVMMRLPLLWQLEVPLRLACDAAEAFIFVNDPGNAPLGAAAILQAGVDAVITDAADAASFARTLKERNVPLPAFLIVCDAHAPLRALEEPLRGARVSREAHAFPGVPILRQCETLSASPEPRFHALDGWELRLEGGRTLVHGNASCAIPLKDYELPTAYVSEGACACGKEALRAL